MVNEVKEHLIQKIIPFWTGLCDKEYGGFYGELSYDLKLNQKAEKGCILNSRITWFFSNAYMLLKDEALLDMARHGYEFMTKYCYDRERGGIYWSVSYDGKPLDTTKHTYNQAFAIYALSSYYEATKEKAALDLAMELFHVIEKKCRDEGGYLEAFTVDFGPESNEKLSENGVMAERTMNTALHVMEAYTQLYKITKDEEVKKKLIWIVEAVEQKIYNPKLHRQEVFFDHEYHTLIDLHSYGHDIETSWLLDETLEILGDEELSKRIGVITKDLTNQVYQVAFDGHSLANECEKGVVNEHRIWWVQAESVIGFLNGYEKSPERKEYLEASKSQWQFIKDYVVDKREGSEWFWEVTKDGQPYEGRYIVEPWKCPYHNGRMCMEVIKRMERLKGKM